MAENRNASAQSVNDDTFEGDSVTGVGKAMHRRYPAPLTGERWGAGTLSQVPGPLVDDLLAANEAFYAAFEARDLDAMSEAWRHEDHVSCTHPGWATLRGWPAVAASWFALFQADQPMQFILTGVEAWVQGDVGWVTLDENMIAGPQAQSVAATNVFTRDDGGWRLVLHHGSGIAGS